jgi:hypothetical protein
MYIKVTNGVPSKYTIGQLRRDNPQTSFPSIIPDSVLADYSVYPCSIVDVDIDPLVQTKVDGDYTQINNVWSLQRVASNLPQQNAERNVREHRDALLSETDYLALSDNTMSAAMTTYRQALRDITNQSGFPTSVTWPTKP